MSTVILGLILLLIPVAGVASMRRHATRRELQRYGVVSAMLIAAGILVEGVLLNWASFVMPGQSPTDVGFSVSEALDKDGNPTGLMEASLDVRGEESRTVQVRFSGEHETNQVSVMIQDDARTDSPVLADCRMFSAGSEEYSTVILRAVSKGKLHGMRIRWTGEDDVKLEDVTLNVPMPYGFRMPRLFLFLVPVLVLWTVAAFGLWRVPFAPDDWRQVAAFSGCIAVLAMSSVCVFALMTQPVGLPESQLGGQSDGMRETEIPFYAKDVEYPLDKESPDIANQAHALMYDSLFHDGVVQVDVSEELAGLDNPYDRSQRASHHAPTLWDYSLYDGKYYLYFGMAPVLMIYAPYLMLFGVLPSYATAALILSVMAMVFGALCVWEAARRFCARTTFLAVASCAIAVPLASHVLLMQSCVDMYYLSYSSALFGLFMALWGAFRGTRRAHDGQGGFLPLLVSGLGTVIVAGSRPGGVVSAVGWLLPLFLLILADRDIPVARKAGLASSYLSVVAVGGLAIAWFNLIRFGNPLDFGHYYQLTVEDLTQRTFSPSDIVPALWYYLFEGVRIGPEFPWVRSAAEFANHSGNYAYHEMVNSGALTMPITWGMLALERTRRKGDDIALAFALGVGLIVCLIDYAAAGVSQRYVVDVLPTFSLLGSIALLRWAGDDAYDGLSLPTRVTVTLCLLTVIVSSCLVFSNERTYIMRYQPDNYIYFVNMLSIGA